MNLIAPLIRPQNVLVDLDAASKKRLFERVGQLFETTHGISAAEVFESLFSREKLGSTALGYGIAIPHGRIKGLKEAACACVRLKAPIDFDAPDNLPVDLVFVLLVPATATDVHLQILGELAQMLSEPAFREKLRHAPDAAHIHRAITEWRP
ncbi:MAG: PTS sugar transporter subunit IIA [Thiobacillaceae bacterium]|nr:PTS sugar transporter subunit IIA [Thiobacillaceae bacterium]MCX7672999.1 PTS sugar transporter subunit IIA [Thiobacillaceae bacterium]MDW8323462.1 PTS sugar transporter subunit IIA [Burkholderiales bacterium]